MSPRPTNVCTIAPGAPFLRTLAQQLVAGQIVPGFPAGDDPAALADATIYVPTRRAARALSEELSRACGAASIVLPRIVPLGAMEGIENDLLFADASLDDAFREGVPEAIGDLDRRLTLMQLILKWAQSLKGAICSVDAQGRMLTSDEPLLVTSAPAQAFHLAGDLANLIDEMIVEDVDWGLLNGLAPEALDEYWRITLNFLTVASQAWPAYLASVNQVDRARRQAELVARRIALLQERPGGVEIIAGSTGTNAATARLIAAIAASPNGAIVLPGLDLHMDEPTWRAIGALETDLDPAHGHPQAALRRLLGVIGIVREDVRELGEPSPDRAARLRFVGEALAPAETTESWPAFRRTQGEAGIANALGGIALVEAADEREEALAIAVALREALEIPQATAALITPDRNLARRVRAELARWDIEIDDSGGDPLSNTPHGILARLALACVNPGCGASALLALLRHPLARLGLSAHQMGARVSYAEIGVLRGLRPDLSDIEVAIIRARERAQSVHAHPALHNLRNEDWDDVADLLQRLEHALAPLRVLGERARLGEHALLGEWVLAHRLTMEALRAQPEDAPGYYADDASAFIILMDDLTAANSGAIAFSSEDYAAFFDAVSGEAVVRGPRANHPRIKSLGLLEARLMDADVIVLGGLDEAIWPPSARTDAFLNRPMRAQLGLSSPERRIGQTAHDFMQALGGERVIVTRALKRGGAPTTPSRFLLRLQALAGEAWTQCQTRGALYLNYARMLDTPATQMRIGRPAPIPDLNLRPTSLSVTRIETLRRDPYAIYAQRILRLAPLEGLDLEEGAREAGVQMHDMLGRFQKAHSSGALPSDSLQELLRIAQEVYASDLRDPEFQAFEWPRIQAICEAYLAWDDGRRAHFREIMTEEKGVMLMTLADGSQFKLTAEADRIEKLSDGTFVVIDFKTGAPPTAKMVNCGLSPQLTLEAKMISAGAFPGVDAGAQVSSALYVKLGGRLGLDKPREATGKQEPIAQAQEKHYQGLLELLNQFRDPVTPYLSRPFPQFESKGTEYDHLSRYREWSAGGEGEGE